MSVPSLYVSLQVVHALLPKELRNTILTVWPLIVPLLLPRSNISSSQSFSGPVGHLHYQQQHWMRKKGSKVVDQHDAVPCLVIPHPLHRLVHPGQGHSLALGADVLHSAEFKHLLHICTARLHDEWEGIWLPVL